MCSSLGGNSLCVCLNWPTVRTRPTFVLTCSNARQHNFLIFTQHSEERDTNTPTWYSVWYLRRRERSKFEARRSALIKRQAHSPAVLLSVRQKEVGEKQELHL